MKKNIVLMALALVLLASAVVWAEESNAFSRQQESKIADVLQSVFGRYGAVVINFKYEWDCCTVECVAIDSNEYIVLNISKLSKSVSICDIGEMDAEDAERAYKLKKKIEDSLNPSASVELGRDYPDKK